MESLFYAYNVSSLEHSLMTFQIWQPIVRPFVSMLNKPRVPETHVPIFNVVWSTFKTVIFWSWKQAHNRDEFLCCALVIIVHFSEVIQCCTRWNIWQEYQDQQWVSIFTYLIPATKRSVVQLQTNWSRWTKRTGRENSIELLNQCWLRFSRYSIYTHIWKRVKVFETN